MDMENLGIWKDRSKMKFNVKKCKNNRQYRYTLGNCYLENRYKESDRGVITYNKPNRNSTFEKDSNDNKMHQRGPVEDLNWQKKEYMNMMLGQLSYTV